MKNINIFILRKAWYFILGKMNSLYSRMLCCKFGWLWPCCSREDFQKSSMYFYYVAIISLGNGWGPFAWIKLNTLYPRMFCSKSGWNWQVDLEKKKIWKVYDDNADDNDDGQGTRFDQNCSLELSWSKNGVQWTSLCAAIHLTRLSMILLHCINATYT